MRPSIPQLPDVARTILKNSIMGLAHAGLITNDDATMLIAALNLGDA